jgi:hypothetical protein
MNSSSVLPAALTVSLDQIAMTVMQHNSWPCVTSISSGGSLFIGGRNGSTVM